MNHPAFFDTNVLVYADDSLSPEKQRTAIELFSRHRRQKTAILSLQVLQEYFSAATRKLALPPEFAQQKVELFARAQIVRFEASDIVAAIELHRLVSISFWDALIVHAARLGGASVLYSEDFQDGSTLGGVKVVNPFSSLLSSR
jgi:predicted nucleic acid-binding protein